MTEPMIPAIHRELAAIDLSAAALWLFCAPFFAAGWLGGFVVRCGMWAVAAVVAGFKSGKGS